MTERGTQVSGLLGMRVLGGARPLPSERALPVAYLGLHPPPASCLARGQERVARGWGADGKNTVPSEVMLHSATRCGTSELFRGFSVSVVLGPCRGGTLVKFS